MVFAELLFGDLHNGWGTGAPGGTTVEFILSQNVKQVNCLSNLCRKQG